MQKKQKTKIYTLRFAKINKPTWQYIKTGKKDVETRAGSQRYLSIQKGDSLVMSCDGKKFKKEVKKVTHFKTIRALVKKYKLGRINPGVTTLKEMEEIYYSYPGYREKIKTFGILAFEIEK